MLISYALRIAKKVFTDDRIAMTPDMPLRASLPHAGHRSSLFPCPLPDLRAKEGLGKFVVDAFHKTLEKLCQLRPTWWTKWSENLLVLSNKHFDQIWAGFAGSMFDFS